MNPALGRLLTFLRERLLVTPEEARALFQTRVVQQWFLTAWRYYAVAIGVLLYVRFLLEPTTGWLFRRMYAVTTTTAGPEPSRLDRLRDTLRTAGQNAQQSGPSEWQIAMETTAGNLQLLAAVIVLFGLWATIRPALTRVEQKLQAELARGDRALADGNPVIATQFYLSAQLWASTPALREQVHARMEQASRETARPQGAPSTAPPDQPGAADADVTMAVPSTHPPHSSDDTAASDGPSADTTMIMQQQEGAQRVGPSGRYELRRMLGAGAMGEVHEAFDSMLERTVALKKLPVHLASDSQFLMRFTQEAKALAKASHGSVVQVYDIIQDNTGTYLALEYVAGGDLGDRIKRDGKIAAADSLKMAKQIAAGMAFAHRQGIVHRDIKPENIMVTTDGQPKITDFGLAKMSTAAHMTVDGAIMGSPTYMSPELANGKAAEARSDIYAFGVTLYEMLTGQPPFTGDRQQVLMQHLTGRVPVPKGAPRGLQGVVKRCTEPKPEDRYPDADALVADLDRVRIRHTRTAE